MGMKVSARGAQKVSSKVRKLKNFGNAWDVGDKVICLYPVYYDEDTDQVELLVGMEWGYKVNDMQALGLKASFIPSNAEINEDGVPVVPDITSQFSRLAPAFIAGEKAAKERAIEAKPWPSSAAQKQALEKLADQYDTKNNPDARKPVIARLSLLITTECVVVPLKDDKPDWDKANVFAQTLSNTKIKKLLAIMEDAQYGVNKDSTYVEVQYNFVAADGKKSTAGRNDPIGVTDQFALRNRFVSDVDKRKLLELVTQLPEDSDVIRNHNYAYRHIDEAKLRSVFQSYAISESGNLDTVPEDQENMVIKSAQLIKDLSILSALANAELKQKVTDELAKITESKPVAETMQEPADDSLPVPPPVTMPTSAPSIMDLMNNPARADDALSDELANVDLAS